jgi:hypothetical protein
MGAGRRAAKAIGAYLQGNKQNWPITQADVDAFVPPSPLCAQAQPSPMTIPLQSEIEP